MDVTLKYKKTEDDQLVGFSDTDYAGDPDNQHSTSGSVFLISGGPISWFSKKQTTVTLSTAEAEYVALSIATQEIVWIRRLLSDLTATQGQATVLMEDNQGAICIAKNHVSHARTKHIDVRYHYVREAIRWCNQSAVLSNTQNDCRYSDEATSQEKVRSLTFQHGTNESEIWHHLLN